MSLKGKTNAWIKPNGHFIEVGYMQHTAWAYEYFEEKYGALEYLEKIDEILEGRGSYAHQALHRLGWVRLNTWMEGKSTVLGETTNPKLTGRQKETLFEWCLDNGYKYEKLFED